MIVNTVNVQVQASESCSRALRALDLNSIVIMEWAFYASARDSLTDVNKTRCCQQRITNQSSENECEMQDLSFHIWQQNEYTYLL